MPMLMTRPDILRFNVPNSGNSTFDPDCETLLEWAARVFTGAPVEAEISELRTELPNVWVRITSVAEPAQPLSVYRGGWVHVTAGDLVGQVITPFTNIRSDKLKATVVPNADWETLVSPPKREVPEAVSHAAVGSHTMDIDVTAKLLRNLVCSGDAAAALVVFHGWSITAALAAGFDGDTTADSLVCEAHKALKGGPLVKVTRAATFDRVASWCTMARAAVMDEIRRLELIQDLYRIRAGLDPYICGPLALRGEQHTIAEAEAAEAENVPRWTKNHAESALVAARTDVARAEAAVIEAAQAVHGSAQVLDADGERWSVGGAEHKELDLAVDALNFAERRLIDAREAAEGFVD